MYSENVRLIILAALFTFALCGLGFGQAEEKGSCPTITVTGPAGIVSPGDPHWFFADVKGQIPSDVRFVWTSSKGEILEGQGTTKIKIYNVPDCFSVTATLELIGLARACPNTASATYAIACCFPSPVLIDEFQISTTNGYERRLVEAVREVNTKPDDFPYIIQYYKSNSSPFDIRAKTRCISEILAKELKLKANEFKIVTSEGDENQVRVYRVPPGAENPVP